MNSIHAYIKINEANREYKLVSRTYKTDTTIVNTRPQNIISV